jgi:hypothetical protein
MRAMRKTTLIIIFFFLISPFCLAESLKITEVFPNPKGTDKGKEWIEITNFSPSPIQLENYQIQTSKKSHPLLKKTIPPSQSYIFPLPLKNSKEIISLQKNNQTIHEVHYQSSKQEQSFSLIQIKSPQNTKKTFIWTTPSKNMPNQTFYQIQAKIFKNNLHENNFFKIKTLKNKIHKIFLPPSSTKKTILKYLLHKKTQVLLLLELKDNQLQLISLRLQSPIN